MRLLHSIAAAAGLSFALAACPLSGIADPCEPPTPLLWLDGGVCPGDNFVGVPFRIFIHDELPPGSGLATATVDIVYIGDPEKVGLFDSEMSCDDVDLADLSENSIKSVSVPLPRVWPNNIGPVFDGFVISRASETFGDARGVRATFGGATLEEFAYLHAALVPHDPICRSQLWRKSENVPPCWHEQFVTVTFKPLGIEGDLVLSAEAPESDGCNTGPTGPAAGQIYTGRIGGEAVPLAELSAGPGPWPGDAYTVQVEGRYTDTCPLPGGPFDDTLEMDTEYVCACPVLKMDLSVLDAPAGCPGGIDEGDPDEATAPGVLVCDAAGRTPLRLTGFPSIVDVGTVALEAEGVAGGGRISVWTARVGGDKLLEISGAGVVSAEKTWTLSTNSTFASLPPIVYVQAAVGSESEGDVSLKLRYTDETLAVVHEDVLVITAVTISPIEMLDSHPIALGDSARASATAVGPSGTNLVWRFEGVDPDPRNSIRAAIDPATGIISVEPGSGTGWFMFSVAPTNQPECRRTGSVQIGGCSSCAGDNCVMGDAELDLGSVRFSMDLGGAERGWPAGSLMVSATNISTNLLSPSSLVLHKATPETVAVRDTNGVLLQVVSPYGVADIEGDDSGYVVAFYERGQIAGPPDAQTGVYPLVGQARQGYIVGSPDGTNNPTRLWVIRSVEGAETTNMYEYAEGTETWSLTTGNGLRKEILRLDFGDWNSGPRAFYREVHDAADNVIVDEYIEINEFPWGDEVLIAIQDPEDAAVGFARDFHTVAVETGRYSRAKSILRETGYWERYDYDVLGRRTKVVSPFKDSSPLTPEELARVVSYDYSPLLLAGDTASPFDRNRPRTITETILGTVVSKTFMVYSNGANERIVVEERVARPDTATLGHADNRRTTTKSIFIDGVASSTNGRTASVEYPDGRSDTYAYESGSFHFPTNPALGPSFNPGPGPDLRTAITRGTVDLPAGVDRKSTKDVTIENDKGATLARERYLYSVLFGGYQRFEWEFMQLDEFDRAVVTHFSNGTMIERGYGCCNNDFAVDRDGVVTLFEYDDLDRVTARVKEGVDGFGLYPPQLDIRAEFVYDAFGNLVTTTRRGGALALTSSNAYDRVGRVTNSVDEAGLVTRTAYAAVSTETILPGGGTQRAERYNDGRTKSVTGSAVVGWHVDYSVNPDGTQVETTYTGTNNSPMFVRTTTDMLGRVIRTERPGYDGLITTENFYGPAGRLERTGRTGFADTITEYDELGTVVRSGLDVNDNGSLDLSLADRIVENDVFFEYRGSNWFRTSISAIYAEAGTNAITTNRIVRERLTGFGPGVTREVRTVDIAGNEIVSLTRHNRPWRAVDTFTTFPDSTNDAITVTVNGLLQFSETKTAVKTTFGYDDLGRQTSRSDGPLRDAATIYNGSGQVASVTDTAGNPTSFGYDPDTGRRTSVTDPLGRTTYFTYDHAGRQSSIWGAGTYPVSNEYDQVYGRLVRMNTFRAGTGWFGATWPNDPGNPDVTRWNYQESTGLLEAKVYADPLDGRLPGVGPSYAYTIDGRLRTRTWARQDGTNALRTVYSYSPTTGDMLGVDYSDDTPDVSFTYTRAGRQRTITDVVGTRTFNYNSHLQATNEVIVAGTNGICSAMISRTHETNGVIGRPSGLRLDGGYAVDYGYGDMGRLATIDSRASATSLVQNFVYTYKANSDLVESLTEENSGFAATKTYEPHRDLLASIANRVGAQVISRFDYTNDVVGRRTARIDDGEGFVSPTTNIFGYNDRDEVTSADMGTNDFAYVYDNIGNRTVSTNTGIDSVYVANALNQYTAVTVSASAAVLLYDLDGNLTNDGVRAYTWNGESRLVGMESLASVPDAAKVKVENVYDYVGRLVSKTVSSDYSGGVYSTTKAITYVWDGFNIVAAMCDAGYTNSYIWGLDLSGTPQGAGGVGGALAMTRTSDVGSNAYLYCFDGNGNVANLVDAAGGGVSATYEYSPFGRLARSDGPISSENPFRWSTKHTDDETGLVMYEFRAYDPERGRWPSRDPIGERGGVSLYVFVGNEPIGVVDVLGTRDYTYVELHFKDEPITFIDFGTLEFTWTFKWQCTESRAVDYQEGGLTYNIIGVPDSFYTPDIPWVEVNAGIETRLTRRQIGVGIESCPAGTIGEKRVYDYSLVFEQRYMAAWFNTPFWDSEWEYLSAYLMTIEIDCCCPPEGRGTGQYNVDRDILSNLASLLDSD